MKKSVCVWLAVLLLLCACSRTAASTWQEQYDLGMRYLSEGNYREAVIAFSAAIEIDPKRADAYIGLADAYLALGDEESALQALRDGYAATGDARLQARMDELATPEPTSTPEPTPEDEPDEENGHLYLLMRQSGYSPDGTLKIEYLYQYDAKGYILSMEDIHWSNDGLSENRIMTYEYSGESGQCRIIPDRRDYESEEEWLSAQYETFMVPGELYTYGGTFSGMECTVVLNALIFDDAGMWNRDEIMANDGIMYLFDYTVVYSFDDVGNPIRIVTYNDAGAVTGTATLEWQLLE